ncbi:response regulator transcription factor [Saccharothrix obliqua]|uniref:response regulator transcription factor n=1 Tax=Saccharothrix obliqua TaxID=2861747 RepID=UPI001C5D53D4|nr:response regulator transcription factor [Saccharothrix obliqua]MBW4721473.1 response regulator transcription factor [Saccharothrix obliqua]
MHHNSEPKIGLVDVAVGLRNDLQRFGLEQILHSLDAVGRVRSYASALDAVRTSPRSPVIILALWEIAEAEYVPPPDQDSKVLLLMDSSNPRHVLDAATIGGSGFLDVQELDGRTLDDALRRLGSGEVPMPARLARDLLAKVRDSSESERAVSSKKVTPREHQVLVLMVEGLSNKQIARRLGISEHGVKRLVASILAKLNCANRTRAVVKAIRDGLYTPGDMPASCSLH